MQTCRVVDCLRPTRARGLCDMHRKREDRTGSLEITRVYRVPRCRGCGSKLRPNRTSISKRPGTKEHKSHGLCYTCYNKLDTPPQYDEDVLILFERMKAETGLNKKEIMRMLREHAE